MARMLPDATYLVRACPRSIGVLAHLPKTLTPAKVWRWTRQKSAKKTRLRRLLHLASRNPYTNHYHSPWHTAAVMVMVALLANASKLSGQDREFVLLATICHDFDHRGRRASQRIGHEEKRSFQQAARLYFGTGSAAGKAIRRLDVLLQATCLEHPQRQKLMKMEPLAGLLADADVLLSLLLPPASALRLTVALRHERKVHGDCARQLRAFIDFIAETGLMSETGQKMMEKASDSLASFHVMRSDS